MLFRMVSTILIVYLSTTFPIESIFTLMTDPAFLTNLSSLIACFFPKLSPQQTAA